MKSLYLIDASSLFFRAYYALPPLKTSKGLPTHALHGFSSMIFKLLKDQAPNYIACCFDRNEPSFRHSLFTQYKMNRSETPEELSIQIPFIKDFVSYLGIPCFEKKSYEADDVIGSLAQFGKNQGLKIFIVSGDKDFIQLVDTRISLLDTMKNVCYEPKDIKEKWGIEPFQMIDYLAIVGDSSDNIPGIPGIGKKGAQKLLGEFKDLDNIYKQIENLSNQKIKEKLIQGKKSAYLSKKLVRLVLNLEFNLSLEDLKVKNTNEKALFDLFNQLELKSLIKNLTLSKETQNKKTIKASPFQKENSNQKVLTSVETEHSIKKNKANDLKTPNQKNKRLKEKIPKEIKIKTLNVKQLKDEIKPYSSLWIFPFDKDFYIGLNESLIKLSFIEKKDLAYALSEKFIKWKGFNLKKIFRNLNLKETLSPKTDLMIMIHLLKPALLKLNYEEIYKTLTEAKNTPLTTPEAFYLSHWKLEKVLIQSLCDPNVHKLENVLYDLELPMIPVLNHMEQTGIGLDEKTLKKQSVSLDNEIKEYEEKIYEDVGSHFNISSPKQLSHILFEVLKLPWKKKTKTGYSTDASILKKLTEYHPVIQKILEYRECIKLKSTYIDSLIELQNKKTKRIHTFFHQTATSTGRLSSTHPNLQNIPIRTKRGQEIRKAFQAKSNHFLICADYNQIELRVLAELTDDPALIEAFEKDQDIHKATAVEIYNLKSQDQVTFDLRRAAKAINFGILYGQGAYGLSEALNISFEEASSIIERYFNRFKRVRDYIFDILEFAKTHGYVETLFGRRRHIEELKSKNTNIRKFGERAAVNAPIQGTASDIVKKSMIHLYNEIHFPLLIQVHDELLFECPKQDLDSGVQIIRTTMENILPLKVKLKVNMGWGKNWEEAHS